MPATLDRLISLSSTIDQKLQERHLKRRLKASSHNSRYPRPAITHFAAKLYSLYNFSPKLTFSPSFTVSKGPENQPTGPTPMEVDVITCQGPLLQVEKDRRHKKGLCLYYKKLGHHSLGCSNKRPLGLRSIKTLRQHPFPVSSVLYNLDHSVQALTKFEPQHEDFLLVLIKLIFANTLVKTFALLDSSVSGCFMDSGLAKQYKVPLVLKA